MGALKGMVKWFDENRGAGVIRTEHGQDVPVRYSDIDGEGYKSLSEGERVEFELLAVSGVLRAVRVRRAENLGR